MGHAAAEQPLRRGRHQAGGQRLRARALREHGRGGRLSLDPIPRPLLLHREAAPERQRDIRRAQHLVRLPHDASHLQALRVWLGDADRDVLVSWRGREYGRLLPGRQPRDHGDDAPQLQQRAARARPAGVPALLGQGHGGEPSGEVGRRLDGGLQEVQQRHLQQHVDGRRLRPVHAREAAALGRADGGGAAPRLLPLRGPDQGALLRLLAVLQRRRVS
mmetsp:Transcript_74037/g.233843  ORF Transcript_74037/g.233843 Transcript_74037/m.233843 type:complete len:218 (-) Transcript_74037:507-1160(-)